MSSEWKSKVGVGTEVKFPTGVGGKGNDGVSAVLSKTDGAIAYVGAAYAQSNGFNQMAMENAAGKFLQPSLGTISAAAAAVKTVPSEQRDLDHGSAEVGKQRVPAVELHLVPRAVELGQGGCAEGVHHLCDRARPGVRG